MKRSGALALAILLTALPVAGRAQEDGQAVAPPPPELAETLPTRLTEVPGTWDLSRDGTNRRCVLTLSKDRGPAGQQVNFPAGCRRALPIMSPVAGWLFADEAVRLVDKDVRPVLLFKRRPDRRSYVATAEGGETYSFVPLDTVGMRPPEPAPSPAETMAPPLPVAPSAAKVCLAYSGSGGITDDAGWSPTGDLRRRSDAPSGDVPPRFRADRNGQNCSPIARMTGWRSSIPSAGITRGGA